jgi:hypothetical protein
MRKVVINKMWYRWRYTVCGKIDILVGVTVFRVKLPWE